jgi:hypothetical protein
MIEDFSSGYYRATMDVQEYDHGPVIERGLYDFINRKLYVDSDVPVMMRVGLDASATFEVDAEAAIPQDVLALPPELVPDEDTSSVFVLKADYVNTVGQYNG